MAQLLVDYSAEIGSGDRVLLEAEPEAEPLVRALFEQVLEKGGHPLLMINLSGIDTQSGIDEIFMRKANLEQLNFVNPFMKLAYEEFESRIRIHSASNPKLLAQVDPNRMAVRSKANKIILDSQFSRGDAGKFHWVTTLYPTVGYAQEAGMSLEEYQDFVFSACHVNKAGSDPLAHWNEVEREQDRIVEYFRGHDELIIRSPNCELTLSIKDRIFVNASGRRNIPDGEIYSGPVETSVEGWIHFDVPAVYRGLEVEGAKLVFENGRGVSATAEANQAFLEQMLNTDPGARYVGELGIGTNYGIQRYTKRVLFDEKIGGTIHLALGSGYSKTGSKNTSAIHWDMVCFVNIDSEFILDGDVIYKDGKFII